MANAHLLERRRKVRFALIAFAALLLGQSAQAGTGTWGAGIAGKWSSPANWSGGVPMKAGDTAKYDASSILPATLLLDQNVVLGSLINVGKGPWAIESDGTHTITMDNSESPAVISSTNTALVLGPNILITSRGLSILTNGDTRAGTVIIDGSVTSAGDIAIDTTQAREGSVTINGLLNNAGALNITGNRPTQTTTLMNMGSRFAVNELTKTGASTLVLGSALTLSLNNQSRIGDETNPMTLSLLSGAVLTVRSGMEPERISDQVTFSGGGGELKYQGTGTDVDTNDTIAGIAATSGLSTVTVFANGATNKVSLTVGKWAVPTDGGVLFRGTNMGSKPDVNVGSIFFSTAPALSGSGSAETATVGIIARAFGDTSVIGSGTDFVTYQSDGTGIRALSETEYSLNALVADANIKVTEATASSNTTINSLLIAAGGSLTGTKPLTISSGDILVTGANSGIAAPIAMGTSTLYFTTLSDLSWSGNNSSGTTEASLVKNGAGALTLSGLSSASYYTGTTTINGGMVNFNADTGGHLGSLTVNNGGTARLGAATIFNANDTFTVNRGGTIDINGSATAVSVIAGVGAITNGAGAATLTIGTQGNHSFIYPGVLSGNMNLRKSGPSTVTLSGIRNAYTGTTEVTAGTLRAGASSVAGSSGAFGLNSAVILANTLELTLDLNGFDTSIGSLTGGGSTGGNVALGAATLTIGGDNTSPAAFGGIIAGTGSVVKVGTGALTLSGANTYTGGTNLNGGRLIVNGSIAGATTVNKDGILAGTGMTGSATVNRGGRLAAENPGTLKTSGDITLNGESTAGYTFKGPGTSDSPSPRLTKAGTDYNQNVLSGNLTIETGAGITTTLELHPKGLVANKDYVVINQTEPTQTNSGLRNYFVFVLTDENGTVTGRFTKLTVVNDHGTFTGTIDYSTSNRFLGNNGLGNVILDGQEYVISYRGEYDTNSTMSGNDVVITAISAAPGTQP